jgi:hypothetical protein
MVTWGRFKELRPDLAQAGRELFYQFGGVGLGFLATVSKDGGPRLHPVCPILTEADLFCLVIPSLKRQDLIRDGRYALHAYPPSNNEDAFLVTGVARLRQEPDLRREVEAAFLAERGWESLPGSESQQLFELQIGTCLVTRTTGFADFEPRHAFWKAPD